MFQIAKKTQFLPAVHGTIRRQFAKLIGEFSSEIVKSNEIRKNLRTFRMYNFFEKFMVVEILTSKDEHFRNATWQ